MSKSRSPTVFLDIDGTIIQHSYTPEKSKPKFLPGTVRVLRSWSKKGYHIILTTGRKYWHVQELLEILEKKGVKISRVIANLPVGIRILVNDTKTTCNKAIAVNLKRNKGISKIDDSLWKYLDT